MSSLLAHLAAGATVYICRPRTDTSSSTLLCVACLVLAVLPDLDYLLWWGLGLRWEPRVTHSFAFVLCSAAIVWSALRFFGPPGAQSLFRVLVVAAVSHLVLDFLVGVHPLPLFWPLSDQGFAAAIGVLPSAGKLEPLNPYLWRNLLIELGILGPLLLAAVRMKSSREGSISIPTKVGLCSIWGLCVVWSISLPR